MNGQSSPTSSVCPPKSMVSPSPQHWMEPPHKWSVLPHINYKSLTTSSVGPSYLDRSNQKFKIKDCIRDRSYLPVNRPPLYASRLAGRRPAKSASCYKTKKNPRFRLSLEICQELVYDFVIQKELALEPYGD